MKTPHVPLTGKQRRHLRALGHHLDPVVQIGKNGVTEAPAPDGEDAPPNGVVVAVDKALAQHELVKVRVGTECPETPDAVAAALAPATKSEIAQRIGRTILLYRRHPKEPKIKLPKD